MKLMTSTEADWRARFHGDRPESILAAAAFLENLTAMLIGLHIAGEMGTQGFALFMEFAADRIPVADKIKMLERSVDERYSASNCQYPELFDDLRAVNSLRVLVAHSMISTVPTSNEPFYWKIRRGQPSAIPASELNAQTQAVFQVVPRACTALMGMLMWATPGAKWEEYDERARRDMG